MSIMDDLDDLWALAKNEDVPEHHRILLETTFDNMLVKREHLERVFVAILKWSEEIDDPGTWREQAAKLHRLYLDETVQAVCWNQTSVNANPWQHWPDCPTCGRAEEEPIPYDITKGTKHQFLWPEEPE